MQPVSNNGLFHAIAGGSEVLKRGAVASAGASPEHLILPPGSVCLAELFSADAQKEGILQR